jgi:hypothetical protein
MPRSVTPGSKNPSGNPGLEFDPFADESGVHDLPPAAVFPKETATAPPPDSEVARRKALSTPMAPARFGPGRGREALTQPAPPSLQESRTSSDRATCPAPGSDPALALAIGFQEPVTKRGESIAAASETERAIVLLLRRMRERFGEGDHDHALQSAAEILLREPDNAEALGYQRSCERVLEQRHIDRLGDLRMTPELAVSQEQVRWLALDHREGFILSLVDGVTSIEEIFDIAGMSRLDVLKTLAGLLDADVIRLKAR